MYALRPITSRLSAKLRRLTPLDDAVETIQIDGPTQWKLDPIVALPREAERIVSHHPHSLPARNLELLTDGTLTQGPCRMHRVKNAVIADGTLLTERSYVRLLDRKERRWLLPARMQTISEGALCSTWVSERFFGHWLVDGLTHELLAEERSKAPLVFEGAQRPHEPRYREITGLAARRISSARVNDLWLLEDTEFGSDRARRLRIISERIRAPFPHVGPEHVFVARGKLGIGRTLVNESEVVEALERRGFTILRPEQLTVDEIIRALKNARVVVAAEGSAVNHAMAALPRSAGILTIIGAQFFNMHVRAYAAGLGLQVAYTIADQVGAQGFSQPIDRLLRTVDLLDAAVP